MAAVENDSIFEFLHMEIVSQILRHERELNADKEKEDSLKAASIGETASSNCVAKLEYLGFQVGQRLIERFTKDTPRFKDELEVMKFLCKDFWCGVFKKQIDNLRTNHMGVYVLQDQRFKLLTQISQGKQYLSHAPNYTAMACGLLRGALSNLGIHSVVTAEISVMPAVKFQIQIQQKV